MIPNELRENPKLMRLHRRIADNTSDWLGQTPEQGEALMRWIELAIAEWVREERRRRKARKRRG